MEQDDSISGPKEVAVRLRLVVLAVACSSLLVRTSMDDTNWAAYGTYFGYLLSHCGYQWRVRREFSIPTCSYLCSTLYRLRGRTCSRGISLLFFGEPLPCKQQDEEPGRSFTKLKPKV
jgi:hypothetical protein